MDREWVKVCIEGVGAVIALAGAGKALLEYLRKNTYDRLQIMLKLQESFQSNARFQKIRNEFENGGDFSSISNSDRGDYAQVFENVALLTKAGFLTPELAYYMFGFEALRCWRNDEFWRPLDRTSKWWRVLKGFASELIELDQKQPSDFKIEI
jgi:hypothetical protein